MSAAAGSASAIVITIHDVSPMLDATTASTSATTSAGMESSAIEIAAIARRTAGRRARLLATPAGIPITSASTSATAPVCIVVAVRWRTSVSTGWS